MVVYLTLPYGLISALRPLPSNHACPCLLADTRFTGRDRTQHVVTSRPSVPHNAAPNSRMPSPSAAPPRGCRRHRQLRDPPSGSPSTAIRYGGPKHSTLIERCQAATGVLRRAATAGVADRCEANEAGGFGSRPDAAATPGGNSKLLGTAVQPPGAPTAGQILRSEGRSYSISTAPKVA